LATRKPEKIRILSHFEPKNQKPKLAKCSQKQKRLPSGQGNKNSSGLKFWWER
jgi:hypothetical protein